MSGFSIHVVVIGAGPGGEAAAKRLAARGARVTLVEKAELGGLCLNWGCIPTKALLEGGRLLHRVRSAGDRLTGADALRLRWDALQEKKNGIVRSLRASLVQRLAQLKISVLVGEARFQDDHTLTVSGPDGKETNVPSGTKVPFNVAVVATGSRAFFPPPFDGLRDQILDSDRALALAEVPESLLVVGGGAVGCEFACLFHELGARVTLVEKTEGLLPGEDPAVVRTLTQSFDKRGLAVLTNVTVTQARRDNGRWHCVLSDGRAIETSHVLVCVGRRPAGEALDLAKAGVVHDRGRIPVNTFLQTNRPHIYAVGDVNGRSLLAHAAAAQGEVAADHILGEAHPYDGALVPRCLYTWPEVASVGCLPPFPEGVRLKSKRFFFQGSPKALASDEGEGFIQVYFEEGAEGPRGEGLLRGAQIIGPHATELIHIFSVALKAGLTADALRRVMFAHPTLSEGIREALSR
jgi:dihydrolipoamide dehydrogenase